MSRNETSTTIGNKSVSSREIGFYFAVLAIYGPAFIEISETPPGFQVWGMLWQLWYNPYIGWYLEYLWIFSLIAHSIVYTVLRPLFAYQMVRCYQNKSSKKMTLLTGLIVESQPFVIGLYIKMNPFLWQIKFLVMRIVPPREEPDSWLDEKKEDSEKKHSPMLYRSYKILETVLVSEIILLIGGGLYVFNLSPLALRIFYWRLLPWLTLITGILFLIVRYFRRRVVM
ncbi:MAG: hypothetical protein ACTSSD_12550 [Candidatus Thorarchaeota archaeon]